MTWKLRVGDYRVIYKAEGKSVSIFRIGHRREVYERMDRRRYDKMGGWSKIFR